MRATAAPPDAGRTSVATSIVSMRARTGACAMRSSTIFCSSGVHGRLVPTTTSAPSRERASLISVVRTVCITDRSSTIAPTPIATQTKKNSSRRQEARTSRSAIRITKFMIFRGASPLGLPYTLSRAPLRRRAPFAWLARGARSLLALTDALPRRPPLPTPWLAASYHVPVAQGDGDVGAGRQFRIVRHEDDGGLAVAI